MRRLTWLAAAAATVPLAVLAPIGARADQVDPGGGQGGYSVSVQVHFSGNAAPGGGGGTTMAVNLHPVCWWEPAPGDYQNAAAMLEWYDGVTGGVQTRGILSTYGPREDWEDAVAREEAGQDLSWYKAFCYDPRDYVDYGLPSSETGDTDPFDGVAPTWESYLYRAFGAGEPIPAPMVTPDELAEAARDNMEIPDPEIDRNPKVHDTDDATLVGLPTFFWVTNPASVGGAEGTRFIRAEVVGAGAAVWAEVTATTSGLTLAWPGGSRTCAPEVALKSYTQGMSENGACTVEFQHASTGYPGGYPVAASTAWTAAWVGSDGGGGALAPLANEVTELIPVAEVQNIVEP
ncbi:hypothetical protein KIH74_25170 [Kineosporia sp. J2-2]|uniref:Uncharacterized protein n=1 Tax=Kineosporia corallincola TaxID=2835133 RepID=A0ABS5TMD6_9ACTN|nr:hypothetical protein [Kineosporia corallincola]MBT0772261.1 hypothetical protein [Kineosporia corallincola]